MAAKTLAFAVGMVVPLLLARSLSQQQFGIYKQVFLILTTANTVLPVGFHMSAFYFLSREPEHRNRFVFHIAAFQAGMAALGALSLSLFPGILDAVFHSPEVTAFRHRIALMVFFWVASSFLESISVANQEARVSALLITASHVSRAALLLPAAVFARTVEALLWAAIAQGLLQTLVLGWYLQSRFPGFWKAWHGPTARRQFSYALPFGLASFCFFVQLDLHNYVVANRFGPELFAVYSVGCFQLPFLSILTEAVSSVMIPRLSELQKQGRHEEIVSLLAAAVRRLALVFFPLYALLLAVGPDFLAFLFSERYRQSWPVFAVNLTLIPLMVLMMDPVLRAFADHRRFTLEVNAAALGLEVVALWILVPPFGMIGAIASVMATYGMARVLSAWKVARLLDVRGRDYRQFRTLAPVAAASLLSGTAAWGVRALLAGSAPVAILLVCGTLFAVLYAALIYWFGGLGEAERELLRKYQSRWLPSTAVSSR